MDATSDPDALQSVHMLTVSVRELWQIALFIYRLLIQNSTAAVLLRPQHHQDCFASSHRKVVVWAEATTLRQKDAVVGPLTLLYAERLLCPDINIQYIPSIHSPWHHHGRLPKWRTSQLSNCPANKMRNSELSTHALDIGPFNGVTDLYGLEDNVPLMVWR